MALPKRSTKANPSSKPARSRSTTSKPAKGEPLPKRTKSVAARKPRPERSPGAQTRATAELARHQASERFAVEVARLLAADKCRDVVVLDLRGRSPMADIFVVASGSSDRQMRSSGEHVGELGEKVGMRLYRDNLKEAHAKWVLLDFVDVVVHLFEPETRQFYDIEMLWGDAQRIEWELPAERKKREAREEAEAEASGRAVNTRNRAGLGPNEVI